MYLQPNYTTSTKPNVLLIYLTQSKEWLYQHEPGQHFTCQWNNNAVDEWMVVMKLAPGSRTKSLLLLPRRSHTHIQHFQFCAEESLRSRYFLLLRRSKRKWQRLKWKFTHITYLPLPHKSRLQTILPLAPYATVISLPPNDIYRRTGSS